MPRGAFRRVFLIGPLAVKLPRWKHFSQGRRCNRWEREMWQVWRPRFEWVHLCPVLFGDRFGFILVMRRAQQPLTDEELTAFLEIQIYPGDTAECKADDHGHLDGDLLVDLRTS